MPIDQLYLGPMLDPFKAMADDCTAKGYSGEDYDTMMAALQRMEALGQEMNDFMEYSAKISAEGLQMTFSNAYGRVLSGAAQQQQEKASDGGYDDQALLDQNLDALRSAVKELKNAETGAIAESHSHLKDKTAQAVATNEISTLAKTAKLIAPIEQLIAYGESGVNFPTFLRVQIEKGLDKAMEGSGVVEEAIHYEHDFALAAALSPHHIAIKRDELNGFKTLAANSKFGVPNSLSLQLLFNGIHQNHVSKIALWEGIEDAWERIFNLIDTWVIAHTRFAPYIEPWSMSKNPPAAVQKDKETLPGFIKERIRLLSENFSVNFEDIVSHETFKWSVNHQHFSFSEIYTEFILETVLPQCSPGQLLDTESIRKAEYLYENKEMPNPENYKVLERQENTYNKHFGEGMFTEKFGAVPDFGERNALPWKTLS